MPTDQQMRTLVSADTASAPGWREDVRLFAFAWAAGFIFFMVMIG